MGKCQTIPRQGGRFGMGGRLSGSALYAVVCGGRRGVGDGTRVRVLPQHACIAGAMHEAYLVVEEEEGVCVDEWVRCRRW